MRSGNDSERSNAAERWSWPTLVSLGSSSRSANVSSKLLHRSGMSHHSGRFTSTLPLGLHDNSWISTCRPPPPSRVGRGTRTDPVTIALSCTCSAPSHKLIQPWGPSCEVSSSQHQQALRPGSKPVSNQPAADAHDPAHLTPFTHGAHWCRIMSSPESRRGTSLCWWRNRGHGAKVESSHRVSAFNSNMSAKTLGAKEA